MEDNWIFNIRKDTGGAATLEYAVAIVCIAILAVAAIPTMAESSRDIFDQARQALINANPNNGGQSGG